MAFDIHVQQQLITAALDDFTPNAALPHAHGGQYGPTPEAWRAAVIDFLHDALAAGLVAPLPGVEAWRGLGADAICALLRDDAGAGIAWDAMHFAGTPRLAELLQGLGLARWDARDGALSHALAQAVAAMRP